MTLILELSLEEETRLHAMALKAGLDEASYLRSLIDKPTMPSRQFGSSSLGGRSIADIINEIGAVDGLPPDLSTNPNYMKGFGELKTVQGIDH